MTPRFFGKYETVAILGHGGMADVYRARHPVLGLDVAIKAIHPHLATEPGFAERFLREARLVASLRHPGIVQVHDFDVVEGQPFMVMEFVDGGTLKEHLAAIRARGAVMSLDEAAGFLGAISNALDYAHQRGAVHRDLKPANILLTTGGDPVLSDFGIAKILEDSVQVSASGALIGTPAYMSPEQAGSGPVDARSDQYSLGVMLFEMVTGRVPFRGESPTAVMIQHLQDAPPEPRVINPELPAAAQAVLLKALAKDPAARFATAGDMARAFAAATRGEAASTAISTPSPADAPTILEGAAEDADALVPGAAARATSPPGAAASTGPTSEHRTGTPTSSTTPQPPSPANSPSPPARRRLVLGALALALVVIGGGIVFAMAPALLNGGTGTQPPTATPAGLSSPAAHASAAVATTAPAPSSSPSDAASPSVTPRAGLLRSCPATEGMVYLEDDFSDPATEWPVKDGPDIESAYDGGTYRVRALEPRTWWATSFVPQRLDASYAVEVRAWPAGALGTGSYGVYFGALDKDNHLELLVRDSGEYRLVRTVADDEQDLVAWTATGHLAPGSPNWLGVKVLGSEVTVCLNGAVVTAMEEPAARLGGVGMVVESADEPLDVRFDDFTVWDLE